MFCTFSAIRISRVAAVSQVGMTTELMGFKNEDVFFQCPKRKNGDKKRGRNRLM